ncbi:MAG: alpha-glucosidase/alpha-galactosidase [Dehalococcoidia bacterium]|nr:alpha-glucosidase/alpha-galactosidase [Dehalococcoidia bacterium]
MAPRIVAIGIGSTVFGVELLRDVFQTPELRGAELWLVDTDAAALARMAALARRLNEASGWDASVCATTERLEALPGARFVVTSIELDRDRTWRLDHELAVKHGFPSVLSENGGPGGLSHTLRSVPPMVAIARDIERLAPDALLLNYTNPENRVCLAVHRYTGVRAIGLCHGVAETVHFAAGVLGCDPPDIDLHAAGVNHFTWITALRSRPDGGDLLPELQRRLATLPPDVWPLCRLLFERLGVFPTTGDNHVGEYIPWAAEIVGTRGYDFERFGQLRGLSRANIEAWGAGAKPVASLLAKPSRESRLGHGVTQIMAGLLAGATLPRPSFIIPNQGCVANLPEDAVVEVPGLIAEGRWRGVPVGPLPGPVAALVQHEIEVQELAVRAAVEGSRALALQALLIDPVVHSARAAEAFLDEVLAVHRPYLPAFYA